MLIAMLLRKNLVEAGLFSFYLVPHSEIAMFMGMKGSNYIFQNRDDKYTAEIQVLCVSAINERKIMDIYLACLMQHLPNVHFLECTTRFLRYQLFIERAAFIHKRDVAFHKTESAE